MIRKISYMIGLLMFGAIALLIESVLYDGSVDWNIAGRVTIGLIVGSLCMYALTVLERNID